ncbi:MAG: bifunctional pyr operon transcriptional regulator/uracil phosphoribosyltransferase PyrR [Rhodocyclaceae bacterium]|nr:bifunctional pyr operon transcriptional regulator/uracil phosphoribosyltransferase PyrR [Rhodocyclaceae bacterium]MBX3670987.1 bifunctional pyr operon transcriptional regulator/uracil phosphoribosyltransferase PyrR [Rhodocyclaceae bacterium]
MQIPDAEQLLVQLTEQMRPHVRPSTCLVGIYTGGVWIAERLAMSLNLDQPVGSIDVSFYRDDYGRGAPLRRDLRRSNIPFEVEGAEIVIVDDVLYTGRTLRAALNELFDYGRPARVDVAVLADRGGRELPIAARFCPAEIPLAVGQTLQLTRDAEERLSLSLIEAK